VRQIRYLLELNRDACPSKHKILQCRRR